MEQNRWISFGNSNISTVELFNIASFMTGYEKAINLFKEKLEKEKIDIAKSLIKSNMSLGEISKHTKIDIKELKKLAKNN